MTESLCKVGIDFNKLKQLRASDEKLFRERTPRSQDLLSQAKQSMPDGVPMAWMSGLYRHSPIFVQDGSGARFTDVDGNTYVDFNLGDLSMTTGFGAQSIVDAVSEAVKCGANFLLPTPDALEVTQELATRVSLPYWQFTGSASTANTEIIRLARLFTKREKILIFAGQYHGHIDETLVQIDNGCVHPELLGLPSSAAQNTILVPFNDLEAVARVLATEEIAVLLTEPILTNCTTILPDAGFLNELRALTKRYGTLLVYDEAHTFQFAYGGLKRAWNLDCDAVVLGKGLGTGISFGLYGMSAELGQTMERYRDIDVGPRGVATGGTTFGNAVAVAAARAALKDVLSEDAYERVEFLGKYLADKLRECIHIHRLPWSVVQIGPRVQLVLSPDAPRNAREAAVSLDADIIDGRRLYLANRGIWDAIASAGPQISFAHEKANCTEYAELIECWLSEIKY